MVYKAFTYMQIIKLIRLTSKHWVVHIVWTAEAQRHHSMCKVTNGSGGKFHPWRAIVAKMAGSYINYYRSEKVMEEA